MWLSVIEMLNCLTGQEHLAVSDRDAEEEGQAAHGGLHLLQASHRGQRAKSSER